MFLTVRTKSALESLNDSLPKIINTHTIELKYSSLTLHKKIHQLSKLAFLIVLDLQ